MADTTDDLVVESMLARPTPPPLHAMLQARAAVRINMFPSEAASTLAAYEQLVIESVGESPASRGSSDEDNIRWLRQQLSLVAEQRAQLRLERARVLDLRRTIEHVHDLLSEGEYDDAEGALQDAVEGLADDQVDAALARAGEAVPHPRR